LAFHARGAIINQVLDPSGEVSFLWLRKPGTSKSAGAFGIEQAVMAIADVINTS
jgi:hypothetical protein